MIHDINEDNKYSKLHKLLKEACEALELEKKTIYSLRSSRHGNLLMRCSKNLQKWYKALKAKELARKKRIAADNKRLMELKKLEQLAAKLGKKVI